MNLREQILTDHTRPNAVLVADWIGKDKKRFDELMQLFLYDDHRVVQRSAWVLSMCADRYPELVLPYMDKMLQHCNKEGVHIAVKRNVTRLLQYMPVPEAHEEAVMNLCFESLADPKEAIAVRCFSMGILADLSARYPEIKNELRHIIEDALEHQEVSAAYKSKAKRVLKQLNKKVEK
jgi:hypothetical protein